MEFEQLQQIWDHQNKRPLFVFDEQALHSRIKQKQRKGLRITNISEVLSILVNGGGGLFILGLNLFKGSSRVSMYLLSAWMILVALYCLASRIRRLKSDGRFDRSLHGDLSVAISVASYQVRFSSLMRWNILPIGILLFIGTLESGKSIWIGIGTIAFLLIVSYASGWEHRFYKQRKIELRMLREKLDNENPGQF
jgi:hypothetical protein